ncbi:sugar phosphate nucleotidyltransferase [Paenibacillus sp. GCM10012306]|uniref:sugar phosphate nucleotidyltransferase n=1 Tax=Paenibacillus sp. GCM10012306 TaxID=3317342 RepID=UPI003619C811
MVCPVVIFCGGRGTRMNQVTTEIPKPLVEINGVPLISHVMDTFMRHGFNEFILCLGYKANKIKDYFLHEVYYKNDITLDGDDIVQIHHKDRGSRTITMVDTGLDVMTGARLNAVRKYISSDHFFATYGDGIADIDLHRLYSFHTAHGRIGTVSGVQPFSQYGHIEHQGSIVRQFTEKPKLDHRINGGFFLFKQDIFKYLSDDADCVLEREPLENLASDGELMMYEHNGFWKSVDTQKDQQDLELMLRQHNSKGAVSFEHLNVL